MKRNGKNATTGESTKHKKIAAALSVVKAAVNK